MNLLARREHSRYELKTKLAKAEFDDQEINDVIDKLTTANLQSDHRFAENYLRYRSGRGYGSLRIQQELMQRGVESDIIADTLNDAEIDWFNLADEVRSKRFGEQRPNDFKERAKQQRFLLYRGFTHEQITESFTNKT